MVLPTTTKGNTMTVFITGDAYMSATYPTLIAVEMLRAVSKGEHIVTVNYNGAVPMILRGLADEAGPVAQTRARPLSPSPPPRFSIVDWYPAAIARRAETTYCSGFVL